MKKFIGIILIGIMFFSSIAFAAIQALYFAPQSQQGAQQQVELPQELVLDYRLSQAQFEDALSRGFTVATYKYDTDCLVCSEEMRLLEDFVLSQEFRGQIILEEVRSDGESELEVASFLGRKNIDEINSDSVKQVFCDLVANPPLSCVAG